MDIEHFLQKRHETVSRNLVYGKEAPGSFRILKKVILGAFLLVVLIFAWLFFPIGSFSEEKIITIKEGSGLRSIAQTLSDEGLVTTPLALYGAAKLTGHADDLKAGDYLFSKKTSVFNVLNRLVEADFGDIFVKFTALEGTSLDAIGETIAGEIDGFDKEIFIDEALAYNGYLFPDTYFILPSATEKEVVEMMHDQFSDVIAEVAPEIIIDIFPDELREKVIMASIIQREALGPDDAYIISGILWKRIEIGMALQVDASFAYLFDKASSEVTQSDLRYDSPYNTYVNKGLPPGPLGNPGKVALDAAFHPEESPYLYYLHGSDGIARYAKNFEGHKENKRKYLR